ncbi:MAG TPA: hypothetical protein VHZ75_08845 [Solirubrobacteraceae bacterium]|jgi:hypothetical protein|nr:hypothetical protein [Solirubrobacteraceae bacterium]
MSDRLTDRVSQANPVIDVATPDSERDALLKRLLDTPVASEPRAPRSARHKGRWRVVIAATLIVVLGGGRVSVATGWLSARTGQSSAAIEGGNYGEILRTDGTDINQIIDAMARHIPLPAGGTFDGFKARNAAAPTHESTMSLRSSLEFDATCQWTASWLHARDRGDSAQMTNAQHVLGQIPTWPGTRAATTPGDRPVAGIIASAITRHDLPTVQRVYGANCTTDPG